MFVCLVICLLVCLFVCLFIYLIILFFPLGLEIITPWKCSVFILIQFFCYERDYHRHDDEKRPEDYLRKEYVQRLSKGHVNYRIQIQIHDSSPSDTATIFHAGILWDKETHPWFDLATVTITTPLAPDVIEKLRFNVDNQPESLGLLEATSPQDYNSIGHLRKNVYPFTQKYRRLKAVSVTPAENNTDYSIEVETGVCENAGTNASISIRITGSVVKSQ